jgi:small nuclear ribonucleoprotein (snRNP)-like protein
MPLTPFPFNNLARFIHEAVRIEMMGGDEAVGMA